MNRTAKAVALFVASSTFLCAGTINLDTGTATYTIADDTTGLGTTVYEIDNIQANDNGWSDAISGTTWLSNSSTGCYQCSDGTGVGDVTYETTFDLSSTSGVSLNITFLVDDDITIYLNGAEVYSNFSNNLWQGSGTVVATITSGFDLDQNTLEIVDQNNNGSLGIDLQASVTTAPEPATFGLIGVALVGLGLYRRSVPSRER